jgi:hypothetical protein
MHSKAALSTMRRIGIQLIQDRKAAVLGDKETKESVRDEEADEKAHGEGRDLLTMLLKANMDTELPDNQRLSDADLLARASI